MSPDFGADTVDVHFGDLMSVVGDDGGHANGGLANIGRRGYTVEVPARTLSDILDEAGVTRIDLMVLDVEGHELDALSGLDFGRHTPKYLLVEALDLSAQQPAINSMLMPYYDFVEALSSCDLLYRARDGVATAPNGRAPD